MNKYQDIQQIGEGAFGKVFKAQKILTKDIVAIKQTAIDINSGFPFTAIREIKILRKLKHKHIVHLKDIIYEEYNLLIIMEYMPYDLTGLISSGYKFSNKQYLSLVYQLMVGTGFLHKNNLVHRDIKPSNILINKAGVLKLSDFGLTRECADVMTNRVCTLWYRAPELLLGVTSYDNKIDTWSIACIMLELKYKKPPFAGNDELTQARAIFDVLGIPHKKYPWSALFNVKTLRKDRPFRELVMKLCDENIDNALLELMIDMLMLDPVRRISVTVASHCKIFKSIQQEYYPIDSRDLHEFYTKEHYKRQ